MALRSAEMLEGAAPARPTTHELWQRRFGGDGGVR